MFIFLNICPIEIFKSKQMFLELFQGGTMRLILLTLNSLSKASEDENLKNIAKDALFNTLTHLKNERDIANITMQENFEDHPVHIINNKDKVLIDLA